MNEQPNSPTNKYFYLIDWNNPEPDAIIRMNWDCLVRSRAWLSNLAIQVKFSHIAMLFIDMQAEWSPVEHCKGTIMTSVQ